MKKWLLGSLITLLSSTVAIAQDGASEDVLRQTGKLYVAVGVLLIIFIGIVLFLLLLERKISKLEKLIDN